MGIEADTGAAAVRRPRKTRADPTTPREAPEFPGCRAITLKRDDLAAWEGRFELWDAATETAWVVREPPSAAHESPSHLLSP